MDWKEFCGVNDFSYLSTEFLNSLETKSSAIITTNKEKGKVVNNFECYIACPINTEKGTISKIGDTVKIRFPSGEEVQATIKYIVEEEDDNRVIVFEIKENIEELIEYRKVNVDIIWWSYKGLKVSNSTILEENDISYVEKMKAGYAEKIYVKVLRQNDTYSVVENFEDEELVELGMDLESVKKRSKLNVYDEILIH